ncbi:RDD family protein [Mucilaginibacter mali]|uniref:RDD family protein n=1 Tax=Mucilaginibacter mali TaxID=2740462 RepID=A0A7D4Q952_9SPHI|nr:RDD family protein [Mucilaginibacter mali]QKJ29244.1 RDD family protein [Mucilaginibacter mali]
MPATNNSDQQYLLVINGKPEGPFTVDELKQKRIRPTDFVRTDGMDDYKEAHELAELREIFGFHKRIVAPQYFGSFDQRLLASVMDWFMVSMVFVVPAFVAVLIINDKLVRIIIGISLLILIPLAKIIYHIVMECSVKQATYGKQILKIRVCDIYGQRLSAGQSIGRNLAKICSVATLGIGYLMAFFNKRQQCLHDMITDTVIVKDRLV